MSLAAVCEALVTETDAVDRFIALLDAEGLALATRSPAAALETLTQRKHASADELATLGQARDAALIAAGHAAGHPGADSAAAQDADVAQAWSALLEAANTAKALNERNGAMIHTHLRGAQAAQAALRAAAGGDLYGANGRHAGIGGIARAGA